MSVGAVVVIGESSRVSTFALGGAAVSPAEDPDAVRRAWQELSDGVTLVVLTERAAASLPDEPDRDRVLRVVMPG